MNPSKIVKNEIGLPLKISKHELIQPGVLEKGLGRTLKVMNTLKVNAEQRTPIVQNRSYNTATSKLNKLANKGFLMHHCFDEMENNIPFHQEVEVNQDMLTSHVRGRGQSLRINAKKRTVIGMDKSTTSTSNLNKSTKKSIPVRYDFYPMKDNDALYLEEEVTREGQRNDTGPFAYDKAKKVEVSQDAQRSLVESKKAKNVVEVAQDANRNEINPCESKKAKKMTETTRDAERSPFASEKAKEVTEVTRDAQRSETNPCESERAKKVRGTNICKNVLRLRLGEKLKVTFYLNQVVGENHTSFTRHLGLLVRNRNMCQLREKFDSDDMNDQRDNVLQHMRKLWNNWRGSLHKNVKSKSLHEVLKDVPMGVDKGDWKWLVKEHFLSDKFKEASTRNSVNRSKLRMPHRMGSKPIREIAYKLGGNNGNPPNMATIFFETRKKGNELIEPETKEKYAEIHELV